MDIIIGNGILTLSNIGFDCPYCKKQHSDINEKYLKRCNKNKSGITKIKCECGQSYGVTYNYMSDIVSFKI